MKRKFGFIIFSVLLTLLLILSGCGDETIKVSEETLARQIVDDFNQAIEDENVTMLASTLSSDFVAITGDETQNKDEFVAGFQNAINQGLSYSSVMFTDVIIEKISTDNYKITGTFSVVIEEGEFEEDPVPITFQFKLKKVQGKYYIYEIFSEQPEE